MTAAPAEPRDDDTPDPEAWARATEQRLLDAALVRAPALGWTARLVRQAARDVGLAEPDAELLLPHGPRDLAALLSRRHDDRAFEALAGADPATLKIRERIARGVSARLDAAAVDGEAARRCAAFLALPPQAPLAGRLVWASADRIWRWAGDAATDENHYSKRAILSGILAPALTLRLFDGETAARDFVAARIENVMAFEKWKAGRDFGAPLRQAADVLSRLRYGRG